MAIAWDSMAVPVVVLTKSDLCDDVTSRVLEAQNVAFGIDIIVTTSISAGGYEGIKSYITKGKTFE
ncbi:MAG: GTPase RsgA [Pelotomaculum sp. PtaB.Bin104]|nr:MAG: GTPase RsgA [Pelotomaculum sp. PtaB.Bin104]